MGTLVKEPTQEVRKACRNMKSMSPIRVSLVIAFAALLVSYMVIRLKHYRATQVANSAQRSHPSGSRHEAARIEAIDNAAFKARESVIHKDQELEKLGIHGEERKKEIEKVSEEAEQEMRKTIQPN